METSKKLIPNNGKNAKKQGQNLTDPMFIAAMCEAKEAGFTKEEIEIILELGKRKSIASLQACTIMKKDKQNFEECTALIKMMQEKRTNVLLVLAIALADIDSLNDAEDIYREWAALEAPDFIDKSKNPDAKRDMRNQLYVGGVHACREARLILGEIDEIIHHSSKKKLPLALQAAARMKKKGADFSETIKLLKVTAEKRCNTVTLLSIMLIDYPAFDEAMGIFEKECEDIPEREK